MIKKVQSFTSKNSVISKNLRSSTASVMGDTTLRDVLVPTSSSCPSVGPWLNLMTKSLESISLPRPDPLIVPALETTAHDSNGSWPFLNSGSLGRMSLSPSSLKKEPFGLSSLYSIVSAPLQTMPGDLSGYSSDYESHIRQ